MNFEKREKTNFEINKIQQAVKMDSINSEIEEMYSELMSDDARGKKIVKFTIMIEKQEDLNLSNHKSEFKSWFKWILPTDDNRQTSFDFSSIRDSFRQHINNRRNSTDLVLLDTELVESLVTLKRVSAEMLVNFRNARPGNAQKSDKSATVPTFSSFYEFANFVVNQLEILNSELWKVEAINDYLGQLELDSYSSLSETQGL